MYSAKIITADRPKKDGQVAIYLQVIINRKSLKINLKVDWPFQHFDPAGFCQPRFPGDSQAIDINLILHQALAKANDIFVRHRLNNLPLETEEFKKEFTAKGSRDDFISFFENTLKRRWGTQQIGDLTLKGQTQTLNKLKQMQPGMAFSELTHDWPHTFDGFMRKQGITNLNTRWGHHKNVKAYLALARKKGLITINPYEFFTARTKKSNYQALAPGELKLLEDYYTVCQDHAEQYALRRFLFMCYTGLRISDMMQLDTRSFSTPGMVIVHEMRKGRDKHPKELRVPLIKKANDLYEEARQRCYFKFPTEQAGNRLLKRIAAACGIDKNLHNHVGRETFGTLGIERGISLPVLQELMGHTKITTTRKYIHVTDEMKRKEIDKLDDE